MNVSICFFSFSRDKLLLTQALRAIPRLRKNPEDILTIHLFDDAASPIGTETELADFPIYYHTTTFNRRGNLNGIDCVLGMAKCFRKVLDTDHPDWLIKADSDVFINDLDWLRAIDNTQYGGAGSFSELHFAHGCLYAISPLGLAEIEHQLAKPDILQRLTRSNCNEDRIFSILIRMRGVHQFRLDAVKNPLDTGRACYQDLDWPAVKRRENPSRQAILTHSAVSFKNLTYATRSEAEREANRADALTRLTAYANWATSQPLITHTQEGE